MNKTTVNFHNSFERQSSQKISASMTLRQERWNTISRLTKEEFLKLEAEAKLELSKSIPLNLSNKRYQNLVVPMENSPKSLKITFQYLAHLVKQDLISESKSCPNYRPLTFVPATIEYGRSRRLRVDSNDWHVANLMILQNLANLFYGISESESFCSECSVMSVGDQFEYRWADGITVADPISIPASMYMKLCLHWTQQSLKNPQIVPSSLTPSPYSSTSTSTWKMVYKRIMRVLAHLYINHHDDFAQIHGNLDSLLYGTFRRLIFYGIENNLVNKKDLEPFIELVNKIQDEFKTN